MKPGFWIQIELSDGTRAMVLADRRLTADDVDEVTEHLAIYQRRWRERHDSQKVDAFDAKGAGR